MKFTAAWIWCVIGFDRLFTSIFLAIDGPQQITWEKKLSTGMMMILIGVILLLMERKWKD